MPKLALFPLGNILLPDGLLPLHVFEKRYLNLVEATVARTPIGIIQPNDGQSNNNNPPLSTMGCSGRIIRFEELEENRYFILLRGEKRFHYISDTLTEGSFREADIRWVIETNGPDPDQEIIANRENFMGELTEYLDELGIKTDLSEIEDSPDVQLINALAMLLPASYTHKQALLEANSIEERLQILQGMMHKDQTIISETKWHH